MKSIILTLCMTGVAASLWAAEPAAEAPAKSDKKKVSYSFGLNYGNFFKQNGIELDIDEFAKGISDQIAGKPAMTDQQAREIMNAFRTEMMAKKAQRDKEQGDKNEKEGAKFLEENAKKEGVKSTASGLQYKVLKEGSGAKPGLTDTVETHYKGTLIDGSTFDSSYDRGTPTSFSVGGVISGWTEALQMMTVGSKWQLFIPSKLAYRERGSPPKIGPNATLVFEIELLSIKKAEPPKPVTSDIIKVPSADELKKGAKIEVIKDVDAEIKKQKEEAAKKAGEANKPK
ncbi:MAG: FKBP-type peptidyl-prolyl cis-trans isomerase [Verrucomicrobia bacterium]|nr:FKBP-type peptidyl-prolyl cis-trans isomerase [Verrucomicrobiota bacterium]